MCKFWEPKIETKEHDGFTLTTRSYSIDGNPKKDYFVKPMYGPVLGPYGTYDEAMTVGSIVVAPQRVL